MADIFLSYAREDAERAQRIAAALQSRGWSVWWDREILIGKDYTQVIQSEIDAAGCIVVLWSKASVGSTFVREEASEGLNGRLVPILVDAQIKQPIGFRSIQTADLSEWNGRAAGVHFERLVQSISAVIAPARQASAPNLPAADPVTDSSEPAIFLSYASGDGPAVARVATLLTAFGLAVWRHRSDLRAGDDWEDRIAQTIDMAPAFVPILSRSALGSEEGFHYREWRRAIECADRRPLDDPFIFPLAIDDISPDDPTIPSEFGALHWAHLESDGSLPEPFVEQLRSAYRRSKLRMKL
jgi:TIR domain-containing protein